MRVLFLDFDRLELISTLRLSRSAFAIVVSVVTDAPLYPSSLPFFPSFLWDTSLITLDPGGSMARDGYLSLYVSVFVVQSITR
jgi:hypothetical protein